MILNINKLFFFPDFSLGVVFLCDMEMAVLMASSLCILSHMGRGDSLQVSDVLLLRWISEKEGYIFPVLIGTVSILYLDVAKVLLEALFTYGVRELYDLLSVTLAAPPALYNLF